MCNSRTRQLSAVCPQGHPPLLRSGTWARGRSQVGHTCCLSPAPELCAKPDLLADRKATAEEPWHGSPAQSIEQEGEYLETRRRDNSGRLSYFQICMTTRVHLSAVRDGARVFMIKSAAYSDRRGQVLVCFLKLLA